MEKRYSDIFAGILNKNRSRCTCPSGYFNSPQKKAEPQKEGCQFGPNCKFDPVPAPVASQCNQAKCTCLPDVCLCGPQPLMPVQLLQGPELDRVIDAQDCICRGKCFCVSEVTMMPDCDRTRCICAGICYCRSDTSDLRLLPSDFRNAVKQDQTMRGMKHFADERLKKESVEIKQLLIEHKESKKKELEEPTEITTEKFNKKQIISKVSMPSDKEEPRDPVTPAEESKSPMLTTKIIQKKAKDSMNSARSKKANPKKDKIVKRHVKSLASPSKSATMSQFTQHSCGCRMPKKKPLHIRYYFAGETEHYGVKLGHKKCMPNIALVPKNMGWLWNIEDPSKGIRERKGWPPGFIGKNIKNMIKVLKQFEDTVDSGRVEKFGIARKEKVEKLKKKEKPQDDPPLLHIIKKGRTYNITFCPKSSDTDVGPIPIPFSITEKPQDGDSSSSNSTLEFEFHSPKPKNPYLQADLDDQTERVEEEQTKSMAPPSSTGKSIKKKTNKNATSKSTEENKILWEEQQTQIENIA